MGSYASFSVNNREMLWWKNGLSPVVASLYTKDDIIRGRGKEGVRLIKKYKLSRYGDDYGKDDVDWEITLAVVDVATLKQRLSIYGYNAHLFNESLDSHIEWLAEISRDSSDEMKLIYDSEIEQIEKLKAGKIPLEDLSYKLFEKIDFYNEPAAIWAILQHADIKDDDVAILDIDDLVQGGWLNEELENTDSEFLIAQGEFVSEIPVIVTEGVSDIKILKKALRTIYPKLESNVRFLDMSFKPENNAVAVIRMIKSFAAAGINNRIIAILDNDAAASEAMTHLPHHLPKNIKVIQYPDLDLMKDYPTMGPQGEVDMDVNGLAGSVEMYTGKDILTTDSGSLELVQWGGYMSRVNKYQGSLINKELVGKRFENKDDSNLDNWQDLKYLWDHIIKSLSAL